MLAALRSRITYANVTASLALFVALGGTGYAALTLPRNSVKAKQIARGAVGSSEIKSRAVRSSDVRNDAVKGVDVDESTLGSVPRAALADNATAAQQATTATTANRATDADALQGRAATAFMARTVRVALTTSAPIANNTGTTVTVSCAADERAIGGSGAWVIPNFQDGNQPTALETPVTASMPVPAGGGTDDVTGWSVSGRNLSGANRALRAYVLCVPKTP